MIFAPIYYTPASVLLANANEMGYDVKMMGCDGMDGILGVEGFDTSLAEGLYLMTPFSADEEKNADFVAAYKDAYDEVPDQFATRSPSHSPRPVWVPTPIRPTSPPSCPRQ